jgi:hypothetical protein
MGDLRKTIDRMVEDAIRRILPAVMNEVLVATIARGTAGIVSEERPKRRQPPKKRRGPVREQKARPTRTAPRRRVDLGDILDESAGAEFYRDPRALMADEPTELDDESPINEEVSSRIQSLPAELRGLAEQTAADDDGGEMWGDDEHDSSESIAPAAPEIRNINEAARVAGVDFSRMRAVIGKTSPPKRADPEDVRARAQFEQARLKRMRERLNDGKPIE